MLIPFKEWHRGREELPRWAMHMDQPFSGGQPQVVTGHFLIHGSCSSRRTSTRSA